jgi:hypothetical protein
MVLTFAPFAFARRRHRAVALFLLVLAFLALVAIVGIPVLREPFFRFPLSALRGNRFVFVTSFALLTLAVVGMDASTRPRIRRSRLLLVSLVLLTAAGCWCLLRVVVPPERLTTILEHATKELAAGKRLEAPFDSADSPARLRASFASVYFTGFAFAVAGVVVLLILRRRPMPIRAPLFAVIATIALSELVVTAWGRVPQCDPSLYYPPLSFTKVLAALPPARTVEWRCLPANLNLMLDLRTIRGYDAVDPQRLVELLNLRRYGSAMGTAMYAQLQNYVPDWSNPIIDMLSVRYVIGRAMPPTGLEPIHFDGDYWIAENRSALPRPFIPREARQVDDAAERLRLLSDLKFDPRQIAYVEATRVLPPPPYDGTARIESESPAHIVISADMKTAGLLVMPDLYYPGWNATINGKPAQILPTNHAVRGVVLPSGVSQVQFRYQPASFSWGVRLAVLAMIVLIIYSIFVTWRRNARRIEARHSDAQ